ncbi:hypothetical protein CH63R_13439 [Colletotrichum higginsianum IMI 349063]|uniref:Uncharacterized protein n=1 Tax=Colletotrichum higginsianum (strain IMI 349063) TaxID=759273 RepID=A0A1B7XX26_COLHI|nr:hypothetical protein CH63R_13439 [Colletotrichum higginsianum IMI 349063]OBR04312.1 hypothetical protein CH63R_13439 [Colletotrichum higginsianum IMI 349063]
MLSTRRKRHRDRLEALANLLFKQPDPPCTLRTSCSVRVGRWSVNSAFSTSPAIFQELGLGQFALLFGQTRFGIGAKAGQYLDHIRGGTLRSCEESYVFFKQVGDLEAKAGRQCSPPQADVGIEGQLLIRYEKRGNDEYEDTTVNFVALQGAWAPPDSAVIPRVRQKKKLKIATE